MTKIDLKKLEKLCKKKKYCRKEIADMLGVHPSTVRRWVKRLDLPELHPFKAYERGMRCFVGDIK